MSSESTYKGAQNEDSNDIENLGFKNCKMYLWGETEILR